LIRATNLKKDNRYPFATISDHSTRVKLTEQWGQLAAGLVVLNHLKDYQASSIGQYYEILPEKSILLVLGAKWPKYAKSLKLKFLEINGGIIIFKDFNDKVIDGFIDEFRSIYQERLDLMGQYFLDKAKFAQVSARNNDVFNLDLVKPYEKKHYFAIVGLFKNESGALKEWIEHYLKFGVDHFYLVDNNSSDNYMQILRPYIDRGLISLYACSEEKYQLGILRELTNILKNETIWVGVFDLDEFVYPQHSKSIVDVIKKFDTYEAIVIPWLIFGSNAHVKQPESIVKGFTKRMKYDGQYSHTKAIVRSSSINILTQHVPWTKNNKHIRADGKKILNRPTKLKLFEWDIPGMKLLNNHYALQSLEFFEKVKVDRTEIAENCTTKKTLASFTELDKMANEIVDNKLAIKE